jgi:predicted nucleotidyltransferase
MNNLTEKERQALRELVEGLKELYGDNLSRVILYGSKARGNAAEYSDIDIMVVLKEVKDLPEQRKKITELVWPICYKHDLLIPVIIKTEQAYFTQNSPLILNIRKEGITIL